MTDRQAWGRKSKVHDKAISISECGEAERRFPVVFPSNFPMARTKTNSAASFPVDPGAGWIMGLGDWLNVVFEPDGQDCRRCRVLLFRKRPSASSASSASTNGRWLWSVLLVSFLVLSLPRIWHNVSHQKPRSVAVSVVVSAMPPARFWGRLDIHPCLQWFPLPNNDEWPLTSVQSAPKMTAAGTPFASTFPHMRLCSARPFH